MEILEDLLVEILEDLLLAYRIPVFTKRAKRELASHPKFYIFDVGVYKIMRPRGVLDIESEVDGMALEGLVAQHLYAWCDYSKEHYNLAFWRTRSGVEVDFIIYGSGGFWAIEVKHGNRVDPNDVRPLRLFLEDYPMAKAVLLYQGRERISQRDILCLPVEDFLMHLKPDKPVIDDDEFMAFPESPWF